MFMLFVSSCLLISICNYSGSRAVSMGLFSDAEAATDMHREYGDLGMTVKVVESMQDAINHIHTYGR